VDEFSQTSGNVSRWSATTDAPADPDGRATAFLDGKGRKRLPTLFVSLERTAFDAIPTGVEVAIDDTDKGQVRTEETGWLVEQATFERLSALCDGQWNGTCIIRYVTGHREVWKLLDEEPFTSLIDNSVFVRLNTYMRRKKRI